MLERIAEHIEHRMDFAFETTLSTRSYVPMLREVKERGYTTILIYIYLESEELAIQRVADRVERGGHSIPVEVIRRRYKRGLANFFRLFQNVADSWVLYDNSSTAPQLIARKGLRLDTEGVGKEDFNTFTERLTKAITKAVKSAIDDHFRKGQPIVVMQNGKLTKLHPPKKQS
jgi:predicted ABC-type ATPase